HSESVQTTLSKDSFGRSRAWASRRAVAVAFGVGVCGGVDAAVSMGVIVHHAAAIGQFLAAREQQVVVVERRGVWSRYAPCIATRGARRWTSCVAIMPRRNSTGTAPLGVGQ